MTHTTGIFGFRGQRSGGPEPLSNALAQPLLDLHDEYQEAEQLLSRIRSGLEELRARVAGAPEPRLATPRPPLVRLEVSTEDMPAVLAFQREVADLPSVSAVTVAGAGTGRASLLVHLREYDIGPGVGEPDHEGPIVCVECGATLRAGSGSASHGLCPDCTATFLDRNRQPHP